MSTAAKQLWLWSDQWISLAAAGRVLRMKRGKVLRLLERGDVRGFQDTGDRGWWKVSFESCLEHLEHIQQKYSPSNTLTPK